MHHGFKHPEEMPFREGKHIRKTEPLRLKILVFDIETGRQIREHDVNYSKGENRDWLAGVFVWAANNKKSVEVFNVRDDGYGDDER